MNIRAYSAELLGTFLLALLVHLSIGANFPIATPLVAGLTLGLIVYLFGAISGAHVNPAVTIALASIDKISWKEAGFYILSQCIGAGAAFLFARGLLGNSVSLTVGTSMPILAAEAIGAGILVLGVSSVVHSKASCDASGLTIGTALALGALAASVQSNGVLNPAVALGIGSLSIAYVIGPIVGGVIAAQMYRAIAK